MYIVFLTQTGTAIFTVYEALQMHRFKKIIYNFIHVYIHNNPNLIFKHIWLVMIWNFLVNTSTELGFENSPKFQSINTLPGKKYLPIAYLTTASTALGFGTIWLGTIKTSIFTHFSPVVAVPDKLLFHKPPLHGKGDHVSSFAWDSPR